MRGTPAHQRLKAASYLWESHKQSDAGTATLGIARSHLVGWIKLAPPEQCHPEPEDADVILPQFLLVQCDSPALLPVGPIVRETQVDHLGDSVRDRLFYIELGSQRRMCIAHRGIQEKAIAVTHHLNFGFWMHSTRSAQALDFGRSDLSLGKG